MEFPLRMHNRTRKIPSLLFTHCICACVCVGKIIYSKGSSVSSSLYIVCLFIPEKDEKVFMHILKIAIIFQFITDIFILSFYFLNPEAQKWDCKKDIFDFSAGIKNSRINVCIAARCAIFMMKKWLCFQFHCTQWFESINRKWEMSM